MKTAIRMALLAGMLCCGPYGDAADTAGQDRESTNSIPTLTTLDGHTYHDVSIRRVEPDGLNIKHRTGIAKLYFPQLPESLRKQYKYDEAQAKDYHKQSNRKQRLAYLQRRRVSLLNEIRRLEQEPHATDAFVSAEISKKLEPIRKKIAALKLERARIDKELTALAVANPELKVSGNILQVTEEGLILSDVIFYRSGKREKSGIVFVRARPDQYADGDRFTGSVTPAGFCTYIAVAGNKKKIRAYAVEQ